MTQISPKPTPEQPEETSPNQRQESGNEEKNNSPMESSDTVISKSGNGLSSWWQRQNLKNKATITAILMGVIPSIVVGAIGYISTNSQFRNQIDTQIQQNAQGVSREIQTYLINRYDNIRSISESDVLTIQELRGIPVTEADKEVYLNRYLEIYPDYTFINILELNGTSRISTGQIPLPNQFTQSYFEQIITTQQGNISRVQEINGQNYILIGSPILDANNQMTGVVVGGISVDSIQDKLNYVAENNQEFYIVDNENNIVFSGDLNVVGQPLGDVIPQAQNVITGQENLSNLPVSEGVRNGEQILIGFQTWQQQQEVWKTIITLDSRTAFAHQNALLGWLFAGVVITGAAVSVASLYLAKRATSPILEVSDAVKKIGEGDLDQEIPVRSEDEIGLLASNFNEMTSQLRELIQDQQIFANQSNLLKNITFEMTKAFEVNEVFAIAVTEIRKALKSDRVIVYSFDENWAGTIVSESVDPQYPKAFGARIHDPCFEEKYIDKYLNGRVQATDDIYRAGLTDCHLKQLEPFAVKANLVAPILVQDKLLGLLIAHQCSSPRNWRPHEIDFLTQTATQIGPALERVMLLENQQLDSFLSTKLKDISFKIAESLTQDKVFEVATEETRLALRSDRVIVYTFDEDWKGTIIAESVDSQYPEALGAMIKDPCFADKYVEKYKQGRVQSTPNIYTAGLTKCHIEQLEPFEVKANLVTPIIVDGELLGLLIAHQCSAPRQWTESESGFLSQLATQIGPALERVQLLERQKLAESTQRQQKETIQQRALELLMQVDPVSQGDLTIRATVTEDEIGTIADSYNATIESLRKLVTQVQGGSHAVTEVVKEQEEFISNLATEILRQSDDINIALERIQSLSLSARLVRDNAEQAEQAVQQSNRSVEEGEIAMNRTVDGILAIRETVAETAKKVKRLGESTQKISKVVNLISSFADQTNLLALNASIEAAHAGEEGRGFAVVAEEVRSLARQSAEATADIEKVVAEIQQETNEVVKAMEAGTEQVVEGTRLVEETRSSLTQITAASAQINQLVTAISAAAAEQSQTSEEITETMADVATIATETSTAVDDVSRKFRKLLKVSENLQLSVSKFKVK
ncbi:methyl-accepting chemotaxis sensory transducer with GAF sensor [Cyanobacterium stanieri PCC 7202]|uniref:Methyl-accepting chemotaxis sensory transducer with GAF sensor n=1 Tax=Cyanobacterium stanieri (strain ATCC 29140 / PCC 7202) TaxID=292563 RepID=K9YIN9_CYASC|nr:methyl-accepting chemotaxis sensory transducer with GAF sensor [Cyanobacterium stanieri PCC 7202]